MKSDSYQIIVDRDAGGREAAALGRRAIEWLVDEYVIEEEPTRCVPDDAARGHRPAGGWQRAIVEIDERFLQLDHNGVEVREGRQVFDPGQHESHPYCPRCERGHRRGSAWKRAVTNWRNGDDDASLACPRCEQASRLVDWRHDPPIGFGYLGLVFWNWPSLNREFIERLAAELDHRLMLVEGLAER